MGSYLDKLLRGIKQVYRNGIPMPQQPVINFIGFTAVLDNPTLGSTDVYGSSTGGSGGGSGGGSILIIENNGSPMPLEPSLNFVGFALLDDPGNTRTNVSPLPIGVVTTVGAGASVPLNQAPSQVVVVTTTGARPSITMPPNPVNLDIVRATFIGASNNNGVSFSGSAGQTVGDPDNPGTFGSVAGSVVSFTPGGTFGWFYQAANTRWVMFA